MRDIVEDVNRFSGGELRVRRENRHGVIAYHYPHRREELVYPTMDLGKVLEKHQMGWLVKPGRPGYLVRAPEDWLVDISDPFKAQKGSRDNLVLYRTLKELRSNNGIYDLIEDARRLVGDIDVYLLDGPSLETEMRIAGSDSRIGQVKKELLRLARETEEWEKNEEITREELPETRKMGVKRYPWFCCSDTSKEFYERIEKVHRVISPLYKIEKVMNGFWNEIPDADVYMFVPKSGFKLALGFVDYRESYDDVMFWEYHAGQALAYEGQMFPRPLEGRNVAIIDISYSGTTLNELHKKVSDEGGRPSRVALFPKSRRAVLCSEYFIFLDKMRESDEEELEDDWAEELYVQTMRRN